MITSTNPNYPPYMEALIEKDNSLVDKSAKYISSVYPSELPVSCFLETQRKWWMSRKPSVRSFFRPCKKVKKQNWNFVLSHWEQINNNKAGIETDSCPHTEHLKEDLENSKDTDRYTQLTFYRTVQDVITPLSKRIGKAERFVKIFAYCPLCKKVFCIGGIKYEDYINLIEYNGRGQFLLMKAEFKAEKALPQPEKSDLLGPPRGRCYEVWETKKEILKTKYDIIWYSPHDLHSGTLFD